MPKQSYVFCSETKKLVPRDEYYSRQFAAAPYVIPDIQPYQSMATGEVIASRSQHRAHLRQHGLIEIGNEINAAMQKQAPRDDREGRKRAIAEALTAKGWK